MKRCGVWVGCALAFVAVGRAAGQESRPATSAPAAGVAVGTVYEDANRNGRRDADEKGLPGMRVSNGRQVVRTDPEGRYRLPVDDNTILFVIKPSGWMTPENAAHVPQFYYINKPQGSPPAKYPGVSPTGPLPASVDFGLFRHEEPARFQAVFFGDTQPANARDVEFLAHDLVEELVGTPAAFGVTLGDVVSNDLSLHEPVVRTIGLIGVPWYYVPGNHDENYDYTDDQFTNESFNRVFGPHCYSFEYGAVHFIVLDDIFWIGPAGDSGGKYNALLGAEQLEFLRNDLALVPDEMLVVPMMHIPIIEVKDRAELFRLLEKRPYTFSISGHTHTQRHVFVGPQEGWNGAAPHHHLINVTACGSWWSGEPDEVGLPHTTMRDGAPNGYSVITFDGPRYSIEFKAARRPATYQMNIMAPEDVAAEQAAETEVLVNVFAGSERSTVEMRLGEQGPWVALERVEREDPSYVAMKEAEGDGKGLHGRKLPKVVKSYHLWRALLPANPPTGMHLIHVRTKDMFGHVYTDQRALRVR
jgi:hypothetical protein